MCPPAGGIRTIPRWLSASKPKDTMSMTSGILRTAAPGSVGPTWMKTPRIGRLSSMLRDWTHPLAERQFAADLVALQQADICVLVIPCGRSAHTEVGWMAGKGKKSHRVHPGDG